MWKKSVAALVFAVFALGIVSYDFNKNNISYERETSSVAVDNRASEGVPVSHVILSLGEKPGDISISWRGKGEGDEYLCISAGIAEKDREKLKYRQADKKRILKRDYYRCSVRIKNLKPGEKYFYDIGDGRKFDYSGEFTLPEDKGELQFLYLGDVQFERTMEEYERWGRMIREIYDENPGLDFAVIGGDMVNVPTSMEQWERFLDNCGVFAELPLMTVSGNHEGVSSNRTYRKIFSMPDNGPETFGLKGGFYCFDYGRCRFIMMDSSFLTKERKRKEGDEWEKMEEKVEKWLVDVLKESGGKWNIAVIHHPAYGFHDKDTVSPYIRKMWSPLLEEGGVDMVFCGHQHMYMRTRDIKGIVYVMGNSGNRRSEYYNGINEPFYSRAVYGDGPNYQIVRVGKYRLEMISYNEKGLIIDETVINKNLWLHVLELFSSS